MNDLAVFAGNANKALAEKIATSLKVSLTDVLVSRFSEGEIQVQIKENIRGKDVFIIQPTCPPPNENLMELLILIDAARRASAQRITAVLPYYGYARQDRKDQPRVPITAKLVANLIVAAGANRVLALDLHASQIQGFFDIPVDHLYAINTMCDYIVKKKLNKKDLVVVSPDIGSLKMARAYAKKLKASFAVVDKRRVNSTKIEVLNILGDVKGKTALMVDDIVATAGSLVDAVQGLGKSGVISVYATITHGILSGNALQKINDCQILKEVCISDSIPCKDGNNPNSKIKIVSVASMLAEAIQRIHNEKSVSCLFDEPRT